MLKNIVLAVDAYDADSWSMVRQGFQPFMETDATVHIAHVIPKTDALGPLSQFVPEGFEENHRLDVKGKLSAMKDDLTGFPGKVQLHQRAGNVHVEILDLADVVAADLIVVGAYGQELKDYHLGPKAARIARHATCSVYIARP